MESKKLLIGTIPSILWGMPSERIFIHVHGKMSRKEYAKDFADIAEEKGYQTLSFDLAGHGERINSGCRCDVWSGIDDLRMIYGYVYGKWKSISLYACSIGAYFSLNAYNDIRFEQCLFQSPIVDMERLVKNMMLWSGVTEQRLYEEQEIETDIDTLRYDYYRYILSHPIERWSSPTVILYGGKDNLQPLGSVKAFSEKFGATLTVSENSEHPFMSPDDLGVTQRWLRANIR